MFVDAAQTQTWLTPPHSATLKAENFSLVNPIRAIAWNHTGLLSAKSLRQGMQMMGTDFLYEVTRTAR